jgi:hypothetical protein
MPWGCKVQFWQVNSGNLDSLSFSPEPMAEDRLLICLLWTARSKKEICLLQFNLAINSLYGHIYCPEAKDQ